MEAQDFDQRMKDLVGKWCDERNFRALRVVLNAWPLSGGLTDDWANLLEALRVAKALSDLDDDQKREISDLIRDVEHLLKPRL